MLTTLQQHWKKEYLFLIVALLCLVAYYYHQKLNKDKFAEYLPIIGGLAFGLNTLITIAK